MLNLSLINSRQRMDNLVCQGLCLKNSPWDWATNQILLQHKTLNYSGILCIYFGFFANEYREPYIPWVHNAGIGSLNYCKLHLLFRSLKVLVVIKYKPRLGWFQILEFSSQYLIFSQHWFFHEWKVNNKITISKSEWGSYKLLCKIFKDFFLNSDQKILSVRLSAISSACGHTVGEKKQRLKS